MAAILEQLELNATFFYQFVLFAVVFVFLTKVYFRPFLKLIELRHRRTVEDRESAEKLAAQAEARLQEYQQKLAEIRAQLRAESDAILGQAKAKESELLGAARDEAKRLTQEAIASVEEQKVALRSQITKDVDSLAGLVSEKLLARKG